VTIKQEFNLQTKQKNKNLKLNKNLTMSRDIYTKHPKIEQLGTPSYSAKPIEEPIVIIHQFEAGGI